MKYGHNAVLLLESYDGCVIIVAVMYRDDYQIRNISVT